MARVGASPAAAGAWRWRWELEPGVRMSPCGRPRAPWCASRAGATGTRQGRVRGTAARSPQEKDQDGRVRAVTAAVAKWLDRRSVWTFRPGVQSGCASGSKAPAHLYSGPGKGQSRFNWPSCCRESAHSGVCPLFLSFGCWRILVPLNSQSSRTMSYPRKGPEIRWSEAIRSPSFSSSLSRLCM